jgi:diphthamide biosynthesis enzyme Dph1/Dph2-like protein
MKLMFIPAKVKSKLNTPKAISISKFLPKNIAIAYSVQFKEVVLEVEKLLSKNHNITKMTQVLGCAKPKFPEETEAILLVGSGRFHATSLSFETKLPVYVLTQGHFEKIPKEEVEKLEKKHKTSYLKFLNAKRVGIIVSTKPGQLRLARALKLKDSLKDKKTYLFINNEINIKEFENFNMDSWVNSACPRLDYDYPIINITELESNPGK